MEQLKKYTVVYQATDRTFSHTNVLATSSGAAQNYIQSQDFVLKVVVVLAGDARNFRIFNG